VQPTLDKERHPRLWTFYPWQRNPNPQHEGGPHKRQDRWPKPQESYVIIYFRSFFCEEEWSYLSLGSVNINVVEFTLASINTYSPDRTNLAWDTLMTVGNIQKTKYRRRERLIIKGGYARLFAYCRRSRIKSAMLPLPLIHTQQRILLRGNDPLYQWVLSPVTKPKWWGVSTLTLCWSVQLMA